MNRSTALFLTATAMGLPAWLVDVNSLPLDIKAGWLSIMLCTALAGGYFWFKDKA